MTKPTEELIAAANRLDERPTDEIKQALALLLGTFANAFERETRHFHSMWNDDARVRMLDHRMPGLTQALEIARQVNEAEDSAPVADRERAEQVVRRVFIDGGAHIAHAQEAAAEIVTALLAAGVFRPEAVVKAEEVRRLADEEMELHGATLLLERLLKRVEELEGKCRCGKPIEHVNADPDSSEWACRVGGK